MSLNDTGEIGGRQARVYSDPAWDELRTENKRLKEALEAQIYHFEQAMNNEDSGSWFDAVQDAKRLLLT